MRNLAITLFFFIFGLLLNGCTIFKPSTKYVGGGDLYVDATSLAKTNRHSSDTTKVVVLNVSGYLKENPKINFNHQIIGNTRIEIPLEVGAYEIKVGLNWGTYHSVWVDTNKNTREPIQKVLYIGGGNSHTCSISIASMRYTIFDYAKEMHSDTCTDDLIFLNK